MENKNYIWRPVSEYTGGRVLATNGLDVLIGEINSEGDCESEEGGSTILCGITGFIKIEEMLPELAESEDEKIRKHLITLFKDEYGKNSNARFAGIKVKDIIAWLEAQGEQKSIWHNEDEEPKRGSLILLIMQSGTPIVAKIIEPNHTFNHGERWAYIDDLLEKQVEPTDIPADAVLDGNKDGLIADTIRCKRENQEWSEEDEKLLKLSLENLTELKDRFGEEYGKVGDCIVFLKSIKDRYAFKPSKEQIEALEHFVRSIGESGYASSYNNTTKLLYSLLADLKKLMEE